MIHNCFTVFRCGRTSTEDAPRSGSPNEVTTPETVTKIHDIVLEDRRAKLREVANFVNISYERVFNILHENLHMKKLSARWVPRLLMESEKGKTINGEHYASLLDQLNHEIKTKRPFLTKKKGLFHYYNAPAYASAIATAELVKLRYMKNGLGEGDSIQIRRLSPSQRHILRVLENLTTQKE